MSSVNLEYVYEASRLAPAPAVSEGHLESVVMRKAVQRLGYTDAAEFRIGKQQLPRRDRRTGKATTAAGDLAVIRVGDLLHRLVSERKVRRWQLIVVRAALGQFDAMTRHVADIDQVVPVRAYWIPPIHCSMYGSGRLELRTARSVADIGHSARAVAGLRQRAVGKRIVEGLFRGV